VIAETLRSVKHFFSPEMIGVSLAPKVSIEQLTQLTGRKKWARMIPNAPSFINQGHNPYAVGPAIEAMEKKMLHEMFHLLGNSFQVDENLLEAYAIVAAMSPTYFWYQWRELADLGVSFGLSEEACRQALNETLSASANLLFNSGLDYEEITDLVPVKPMQELEESVKKAMEEKLSALYEKIKPHVLTT
jgi:pyrroline-5-carboxylate reductase